MTNQPLIIVLIRYSEVGLYIQKMIYEQIAWKTEGIFARGRGFFIMLTLVLSTVVLVAIEIEKLWVKSRLRLHLAVQFGYQLWRQLQTCGQHGEIGLLGGGIHIDGQP